MLLEGTLMKFSISCLLLPRRPLCSLAAIQSRETASNRVVPESRKSTTFSYGRCFTMESPKRSLHAIVDFAERSALRGHHIAGLATWYLPHYHGICGRIKLNLLSILVM